MKKNYLLLFLLCISYLGFSQGAEFTIDFDGADPLNSLPAGVTSVSGSGEVTALNGSIIDVTQLPNTVVVDGSNNVLSMDYQGYLVFDETAIGTGSFTIGGYYDGKENTVQWLGFITITGNDPVDGWKARRLQHQYANGTMNGLSFTATAANGFPTNASALNHFVLTFDNTTGLYDFYKNGVSIATSGNANNSVTTWTGKKLYLGYKGGTQNASNGDFDTAAYKSTLPLTGETHPRTTDVRSTVDDITVFKRAITEAEALALYTNGTLAVNKITLESFNAYPNPVKDRLYFSTKSMGSVEFYNLLGYKISSQKTTDNSVDTSALSNGVYIVKCQNTEGVNIATLKILIE